MRFEYSAGSFVYTKDRMRDKILFLLLIKENGEYDMPKGHIEKGESAETAAKREVNEETGLDISIIPYFSTSTSYFFHSAKGKTLKKVRFFLSYVEKPRVRISYEHKGYEWADYDEAVKKIKYKDLIRIFPNVKEYAERYELIRKLNYEYSLLPKKEKAWELSCRLVPGDGPLNGRLMLVGQAPGRLEDKKLRPFVGRSGKLLDRLLSKIKIGRKNAYITSVVQFFPPKNRMPTDMEVELCKGFLFRQIEIIKPRYAILLGNLASSILLGMAKMHSNHGTIIKKDGITYMVTFHPAAALRFRDIFDLMLEDFKKFKGVVNSQE